MISLLRDVSIFSHFIQTTIPVFSVITSSISVGLLGPTVVYYILVGLLRCMVDSFLVFRVWVPGNYLRLLLYFVCVTRSVPETRFGRGALHITLFPTVPLIKLVNLKFEFLFDILFGCLGWIRLSMWSKQVETTVCISHFFSKTDRSTPG